MHGSGHGHVAWEQKRITKGDFWNVLLHRCCQRGSDRVWSHAGIGLQSETEMATEIKATLNSSSHKFRKKRVLTQQVIPAQTVVKRV